MRTAEALKKAIEQKHPGAEVTILDTFRYASPLLEKVVLGTYMEILKLSPVIYGYLYRQAERGQPLSGRGKMEFNRILNMLAAPRLVEFINKFQPQAIVCTHPFPLGIISFMKRKGALSVPVLAIITDFTLHSFWVFPKVDTYIAGAKELYPLFDEFRIDSERVRATGIPIDPAFSMSYNKEELKVRYGLETEVSTALIMGGGLGMGPLASAVKSLVESHVNCQLLVVAGANKSLYDKLRTIVPEMGCKVKVFGYVDNIHELMEISDFMIGKAGGLTCAEAMAKGLPLFIVDPLPGQEERNTEFFTGLGAAVRVEEKELPAKVRYYLSNPSLLAQMAAAARALGRPSAAYDAVQIIEESLSDKYELKEISQD
ncbi:MAG: glycosyltransferase [Firmicutes bacterium]|nr:glycosyltransferase [Bacillota bacterium]